MILQEDINKLLTPNTYSEYLIIGQNVKSKKELIEDIVNSLSITFRPADHISENRNRTHTRITLFNISYYFAFRQSFTDKNKGKFIAFVRFGIKGDRPIFKVLVRQKKEFTWKEFYTLIAQFLLTKLNETTT